MTKVNRKENAPEGCSETGEAGDPDFLGELARARGQDRGAAAQWLQECLADCVEIVTRKPRSK
jgi:hypothetical protein